MVFTFVFFMQKLTRIRSGQNNESCRIIHHESNKIGFEFFQLFCDFLRNLQESGNHFYYWSSPFTRRTLERVWVLQCSPWGAAGAAGLNSSEVAGARGRGRTGEWSRGALGPIWGFGQGGGGSGDQLADSQGGAAAAVAVPARCGRGRG
jgi:hypothetical protein